MKASISYQELQRLITEKAQQPISFQFVDDKTIKVCYTLNLGLVKKDLGINLRIMDFEGPNVRVSYATGFGMDSMVGMALDLLKKKIPAGLIEELPDKELLVHLNAIDGMQQVFDTIEVNDINMLMEGVELKGEFKS